MAGTMPGGIALVDEVLGRIVDRFTAMAPNGIEPPSTRETIQMRIGTLVAEATWAEIAELTGVPDPRKDTAAVGAAFPAIQAGVRGRHVLTKRLMIRVWTETGLADRLVDRLRPGSLLRSQSEWLVWGENADRWTEEP
jgi:hypothetical protein